MDLQKINNTIEQQVEVLNTGLHWVDTFLTSEKQRGAHDNLVNIRRELRKIRYAFNQNPSAALYGESQVGKSYLVKNLLAAEEQKDFIITDYSATEGQRKEYVFLEDINPEGGGTESTALVTRFSTNIELKDVNYPVYVKILNPKDIVLILLDSYHEDIEKYKHVKTDDIKEFIVNELPKLTKKQDVQNVFIEDDIIDIKEYLEEYFSTSILVSNLKDSDFWSALQASISKIPPENWKDIFSLFWGKTETITNVFSKLITNLQKLDFTEVAYIEFKAVLRKYGSILDVKRLHELNDNEFDKDYIQDVKILTESNIKLEISKNVLCALIGELTFKLDKSLELDKKFLKRLDLLDFPGARSRLEYNYDKIEDSIPEMILRGKVSYIFNKYSIDYLISNLLFCNRSEKTEVSYIPKLLDTWINRFIGKTPEEREVFLQNASVDPLFVIYTWYNKDIAFNSTNQKEKADLFNIWEKRFVRIFEKEIIGKNFNWHISWRKSNLNFQNNYLLRDLLYSSRQGIFEGFEESRVEISRNSYPNYEGGDYWKDLRETFLEYPFVKRHFKNPEETWEETSTLNNDGSVPIIRNLTIASESTAREEKFMRDLVKLSKDLHQELQKFYHDDKADDKIMKAVQKAGRIQLDLDTTFGRNQYFFGNLMQKLLVKESEIYNFYREKFDEIEIVEKTDLSRYSAIRMANPDLKINAPFEYNLNVLKKTYGNMSDEEMIQYFEEMEIDLDKLFNGEAINLKTNSIILANGLIDKWVEEHLIPENFKTLTGASFSNTSIDDLLDNIKSQTIALELREKIAKNIRRYVDTYDKIDKVFEMIADISTAMINKFINTMGYEYYTDEKIDELKKTNQDNDLNLVFNHDYLNFEPLDQEGITNLFNTLDRLDEILNETPLDISQLKNVPQFSNFQKWKDFMRISFVSSCEIPTYDPLANKELGDILEKTKQINYN